MKSLSELIEERDRKCEPGNDAQKSALNHCGQSWALKQMVRCRIWHAHLIMTLPLSHSELLSSLAHLIHKNCSLPRLSNIIWLLIPQENDTYWTLGLKLFPLSLPHDVLSHKCYLLQEAFSDAPRLASPTFMLTAISNTYPPWNLLLEACLLF